MATSAKERKRQQRVRDKARSENVNKAVQQAIDTMPPEYAADCRMWISPPGPKDERPRVNWDIGAETHALMETHAKAHNVTMDAVLREVGVQFAIAHPKVYWAMKSAKITISDN